VFIRDESRTARGSRNVTSIAAFRGITVPSGQDVWPLFGRTATINTTAYCAPVSGISAGQQ